MLALLVALLPSETQKQHERTGQSEYINALENLFGDLAHN